MNILNTILNAQGGKAVGQLAQQFGLDQGQADSVLSQLVPALAGGVKNNINQQDGLDSLISALNKGNHGRYLDDMTQLSNQSTTDDGNAILGHIFGSKDVSRQVASRAAASTGVDSSILKKMLPVIATMVMGGMSQQSSNVGGALGSLLSGGNQGGSSALGGILGSFLDADGDGSIADDLLKKFL